MRWSVVLMVLSAASVTSATSGAASADCLTAVRLGDPGFVVIEKCGEPQRREREEHARTSAVEMVRGGEVTAQLPLQPLRMERWYYETSLNAATVFHLEDGGVVKKERLRREE